MRLLMVAVAALLLLAPVRSAAQQTRAPVDVTEPTLVGGAVHWCIFNRPCNWASHASIALGIAYGMDRLGAPPRYAAGAAALVFIAKEIRDDRKWGNVLGTPDSMGDMLSGFVGASVGFVLLRDRGGPVDFAVTGTNSMTVGVQIQTR